MRVSPAGSAFYLIAALVAITMNFFIPRLVPGNPVAASLANLHGTITAGHHQGACEKQFGLQPGTRPCGTSTCITGVSCCTATWASPPASIPPVSSVISGGLPWTLGPGRDRHGDQLRARHRCSASGGLAPRQHGWTTCCPRSPSSRRLRTSSWRSWLVALLRPACGWFPLLGGYDQLGLPGLEPGSPHRTCSTTRSSRRSRSCSRSAAGWIVGMRNVMVTTMDEDYVLWPRPRACPSGGWSGTRRGTRSCPACPGSRWPSASWCPGRCSPRSSSTTPASAILLKQAVATTTTRCCRACS